MFLTITTSLDKLTREVNKVTDRGIKNIYKNATILPDYIAHSLCIFELSLHLRELYGDKLQFFTRMQLIPFSYFPA